MVIGGITGGGDVLSVEVAPGERSVTNLHLLFLVSEVVPRSPIGGDLPLLPALPLPATGDAPLYCDPRSLSYSGILGSGQLSASVSAKSKLLLSLTF